MCPVLKNKHENKHEQITWQPSASLKNLKKRAAMLAAIREFFIKRDVLEVETPLLCQASVTDPLIESIATVLQDAVNSVETRYYLQTSPEYAMKRLLAAGSGPIFQMSKAFRQGERGRYHNPEFSILEWYRLAMTHHLLMDEVDAFLQDILKTLPADRYSYKQLFESFLAFDPHTATLAELARCAAKHHIELASDLSSRDAWLHLLLSHLIEPNLGKTRPVFIYDFPPSQCALAKIIDHDSQAVAARFEVYYRGIELANGFYELQDAVEQRKRFEDQAAERRAQHLKSIPVDAYFLAALEAGLPECAGVAVGLDRLLMLQTSATHIAEVLSFDITRA